ncbi:hypothetical protein [Burkholderia pseudomultivorans]|uniref:hypothetical protein n=1 Tax=Burkholderia pseudomultivorans TaxID=1207504 RepID=UPI0020C6FE45|nr:hypothetical protein [Burkholderia pseudomultivorans]
MRRALEHAPDHRAGLTQRKPARRIGQIRDIEAQSLAQPLRINAEFLALLGQASKQMRLHVRRRETSCVGRGGELPAVADSRRPADSVRVDCGLPHLKDSVQK